MWHFVSQVVDHVISSLLFSIRKLTRNLLFRRTLVGFDPKISKLRHFEPRKSLVSIHMPFYSLNFLVKRMLLKYKMCYHCVCFKLLHMYLYGFTITLYWMLEMIIVWKVTTTRNYLQPINSLLGRWSYGHRYLGLTIPTHTANVSVCYQHIPMLTI